MPKLSSRRPLQSGLLDAIRSANDFQTHGALRGETVSDARWIGTGILPTSDRETLRTFGRLVDFVVYSYDTPIAYRVTVDGDSYWVVPDVRYSVTTSKHQGTVRWALHDTATLLEV